MASLIALLWIAICLIVQVLIFNHLSLAGGVVFLYMYMVVKLPVELPRSLQILLGFVIGFLLDVFANTPGLHSFSCTTIMWLRLPVLHMFVMPEDIKNGSPTLRKIGFEAFLRYLATVLVTYSIILYVFEAFTLFNPLNLLLKIVTSVIMTFAMLFALEMLDARQ